MNSQTSLDALLLALPTLGWEQISNTQDGVELWAPGARAQVIENQMSHISTLYVPTNTSAPDFSFNMAHVLDALKRISATDVAEHLAMAEYRVEHQMDEFELRSNTSSHSGVLPWKEGVDLVNGARAILDASARASQKFDRHFANQSSTIAANFLDGCYMGQTRVGSYIVTALVPAMQQFSTTTSKKQDKITKLTGRTISETLITSLQVAREAIETYVETKDSEVFELGVTQGLSYELFSGIDEVIGEDETEMTVDFLPLSPDQSSNRRSTSIVFDQNHKEAITKGMEVLGAKPASKKIHLTGEVTMLRRKIDDPSSSLVKLKPLNKKRTRTYSVKLSDEDYETAMEAHRRKMQLEVEGTATNSSITEVSWVNLTAIPVSEDESTEKHHQEGLF